MGGQWVAVLRKDVLSDWIALCDHGRQSEWLYLQRWGYYVCERDWQRAARQLWQVQCELRWKCYSLPRFQRSGRHLQRSSYRLSHAAPQSIPRAALLRHGSEPVQELQDRRALQLCDWRPGVQRAQPPELRFPEQHFLYGGHDIRNHFDNAGCSHEPVRQFLGLRLISARDAGHREGRVLVWDSFSRACGSR